MRPRLIVGMRFFHEDGRTIEGSDESDYFIYGYTEFDGSIESIMNGIYSDESITLSKEHASNIKYIIDFVLNLSNETINSVYSNQVHIMFLAINF
jgi:hypothetical protein